MKLWKRFTTLWSPPAEFEAIPRWHFGKQVIDLKIPKTTVSLEEAAHYRDKLKKALYVADARAAVEQQRRYAVQQIIGSRPWVRRRP